MCERIVRSGLATWPLLQLIERERGSQLFEELMKIASFIFYLTAVHICSLFLLHTPFATPSCLAGAHAIGKLGNIGICICAHIGLREAIERLLASRIDIFLVLCTKRDKNEVLEGSWGGGIINSLPAHSET